MKFLSLVTLAGVLVGLCSALTARPNAIGKALAAREKAKNYKDAKPKALRDGQKTSLGHQERTHLSARHGVAGEANTVHKDGKCGAKMPKKKHQKKLALLQEAPVSTAHPGAGKNPEDNTAYEIIYKDGFWPVGCFNDHVRIQKDLHSAQGSHRYQEDFSDISIVWYHESVEKEDLEKMSPKVCYEFCRTVKDMGFFGLYAGTDCYCAPYYKRGEGGEGDSCDLPCEGDMTVLCGGKSKSSLYEMHLCDDAANDLSEAVEKGADATNPWGDYDLEASNQMTASGDELEKHASNNGDLNGVAHAKAVKTFGGDYERAAEACKKDSDALQAILDKEPSGPFQEYKKIKEAEAVVAELKPATTAAAKSCTALEYNWAVAEPRISYTISGEDDFKAYFPVTFYTDGKEEHLDAMSTCDGTISRKPAVGVSRERCASICSGHVKMERHYGKFGQGASAEKCTAFQYYESDGEKGSLCILFSDVTAVSYYTCPSGLAQTTQKMLRRGAQKVKAVPEAQCYQKVSDAKGFAPTANVLKRCWEK